MNNFLLIEDEDTFAENLLCELAELGATTKRASNGNEGLDLLKENHYDGIILDMRLGEYPDVQGMQILEWVTENKNNTAVIVVTGHPHLAFRALELGVDGVLHKPVDSQHVLQYLIRAVELRSLRIENIKLKKSINLFYSSKFHGYIFSFFVLMSIFIWRIYFPNDWIGLFVFFLISLTLLIGSKRISRMVLNFMGQKLEIDAQYSNKENDSATVIDQPNGQADSKKLS